ncbi:hypothetical protein [Sphingorhabdus sp.]|uniref:hypothetical protein n=1 Tax=Sphingorhabdus sp. TaxID=1902408 RepID=UPI00333E21EA
MSKELDATHKTFVFIATALLISACLNVSVAGIGGFIAVGFAIYGMSAIMSGFKQGEEDALQNLKRSRRKRGPP